MVTRFTGQNVSLVPQALNRARLGGEILKLPYGYKSLYYYSVIIHKTGTVFFFNKIIDHLSYRSSARPTYCTFNESENQSGNMLTF